MHPLPPPVVCLISALPAVTHLWWRCRGFRESSKNIESYSTEVLFLFWATLSCWAIAFHGRCCCIFEIYGLNLMHRPWGGLWSFNWQVLMPVVFVVDLCRQAEVGFVSGNSGKQSLFLCLWILCVVLLLQAGKGGRIGTAPSSSPSLHCLNKWNLLHRVCFNWGGKWLWGEKGWKGNEDLSFDAQKQLQWDGTDDCSLEGQWLNFANFSVIREGGVSKKNGGPVHGK